MVTVHRGNHVKLLPLLFGRQSRVSNVLHLSGRRSQAGITNRRSLAMSRQKSRAPIVDSTVRQRRTDRHVSRQVLVLGSQPVDKPRPHARPHELVGTGVQFQQRSAMSRVGAVDRSENAQIVDVFRHVRKQGTDRQSALAMLLELPRRPQQIPLLGERHSRQIKRKRLSTVAIE